jgi:hypothetical protein
VHVRIEICVTRECIIASSIVEHKAAMSQYSSCVFARICRGLMACTCISYQINSHTFLIVCECV